MPNEQPLYQQLADNIRSKIASGEYKVGDKIMSERKMAEIYDLNRLTVRKALDVLIQEGSLSAIRGSGTYVKAIVPANKKVHFGNDESISLSTVLRQSGFQSSRKVLSFRRIKTSGALKDFFPETEDVYELIRLSSIDKKPYALQICSFPANIFQQPERFDFAQESLYTYMELQGHYPKTVIADMWLTPIPNEYSENGSRETCFLLRILWLRPESRYGRVHQKLLRSHIYQLPLHRPEAGSDIISDVF